MKPTIAEIDQLVVDAIALRERPNATRAELHRSASMLQQAIELRAERLGPNHPDVGYAYNELGRTQLENNLRTAAIDAFRAAHAIYLRFSDQLENQVTIGRNLALALSKNYSHREAYEVLLRAQETTATIARNYRQRAEGLSDAAPKPKPQPKPVVKAADIKARLDISVIGQHAAKRTLATAAEMHIRRINLPEDQRKHVEKSNVLVVGPSGSGKTALVRALARAVDLPFVVTQITNITEAGYVGGDVEDLLTKLLIACDYDVKKAQFGIIFVDELDKKARAFGATGRDVSGEGVQQALLTMLEGAVISVPGKTKNDPRIDIDTRDILFITSGAFVGLEALVALRSQQSGQGIGFGATLKSAKPDLANLMRDVRTEDFVAFGLIPELLGRLPVRTYVRPLTVAQMKAILTMPEDALLKQKELLFGSDVELVFTEGALEAIATEAVESGTGARALRSIVEEVLEPVSYTMLSGKVVVERDDVLNRKEAISALDQREEEAEAATWQSQPEASTETAEKVLASASR